MPFAFKCLPQIHADILFIRLSVYLNINALVLSHFLPKKAKILPKLISSTSIPGAHAKVHYVAPVGL